MRPQAFLYAAAIFLSSSLLFLVEPMAGKRLLPLLGGSAAVWITCLVFFQTALLLGYLCAHWIATRLRSRAQAVVYVLLLVISLVQVARNLNPHLHSSTLHPIISVLSMLTVLIGLPFLALSATNPLLQAWYSRAAAKASDGAGKLSSPAPPYRLFALSNFGSLVALIIYPVLVEPYFSLRVQTLAWSAGFLIFVVVCGTISFSKNLIASSKQVTAPEQNVQPADPGEDSNQPPTPREQTLWLLMAACGALLLSAVTNHLSQNIAAIPLLWILPLTIYLLTFVIAFNGGLYFRWPTVCLLAIALGSVACRIIDLDKQTPIKISIPLFCIALFIACLFCHGELYRRRPSPRYTTQYYLLIAAGGALGSMFVGVLAPFIFVGSYEMAWSLVYTAALAAVLLWRSHWLWTLAWSIVTAAMLVVVVLQVRAYGENTIVQVRSFYGTMRVQQETTDEGEMYRTLVHGTIQHGTQYFGDDEDRTSPTTYYVHNAGIGLALDWCCNGKPRRVGVVGLGAGTLAAYGKPGDVFRFYEIDPRVETIARNAFTYLRESKAKIELVEGDARLSMEAEPAEHYDVIAVDAFSGDAIPVHLLTAEALRLYQRHLRPGGILAFHISNSFLDLAPVVKAEAEHAGLPAVLVSTSDDDYGGYAADWVLITRNQVFLSLPAVKDTAEGIETKPGLRLWTDDYSSLLPILKFQSLAPKD
ncbi:MAG TPA: fused MFS/spermidine synthase [Candidatus Angelobacter sp.]|nr:fused MFS/spermidine synthase [Candidatus Angelobacter sp.]